MLRRTFLWLSERRGVFEFIKRNGFARRIAGRFVAGETLETAIEASRMLNGDGTRVSLDLLGESVTKAEETHGARREVIETLEGIARSGVDGNISLKLTQLGLDISTELCTEHMRVVLRRALELGIFVRMDMESSDYTQRTLDLFLDVLQPEFADQTGVVIQSYLRRSAQDVEKLIARGARVRLCKGAYAEPESVAFQSRREVAASFVALMERLLERGNYPGIATHDERLINHAVKFVVERGIPAERFEFQMLYGVRRDLQQALRRGGYNLRVYIPFGTAWYPYLMRRLAERPTNIASMTVSVIKEALS